MPDRLPRPVVAAVDAAKIIGVRAGARSDHRFIGVWAVVVDGRVFARPYYMKPGGWFDVFLADSAGALQVGERTVRVRARRVRGERQRDAVQAAYAAKYRTPGGRKYVKGFRTPRRREAILEFVPR